jgi:hypothetical protein
MSHVAVDVNSDGWREFSAWILAAETFWTALLRYSREAACTAIKEKGAGVDPPTQRARPRERDEAGG